MLLSLAILMIQPVSGRGAVKGGGGLRPGVFESFHEPAIDR